MRKLIALAMVLAVTSVHAAEELRFGDINYFIKKGEFNLTADVSSTYEKRTIANETLETRGVLLETSYGFGFTDQFNIYLGLDYAWDREVENKTTPAATDYTQNGLANPSIAANYRVLNQGSSAYNLDLGAVARINIEDAEEGDSVAGDANDGNFANGRSSLEVNLRAGKKWNEANEWQFGAGVVYNHDGDYTQNLTTGDREIDLDSSVDLYLRAAYQYRPVETFMMLISAQATRVGQVDGEDNTNADIREEDHVDWDFGFTAKYLITDNFITKFNYGISSNRDYTTRTGGVAGKVESRKENFLGLGVEFLF